MERRLRRTPAAHKVVGIFPNRAALLPPRRRRPRGAERSGQSGRRYFSTESMNKLYQPSNEEVVKALLDLESA
jgi:hypothetical protein